MWSPSVVILNSNTFHLHLKNNFHSSLSLSFKILLSNLHGLMGSLYSTYCHLVLPFFLMLTSLPLWFIEWIPSTLDPLSLWCVPWLARYLFGFSFWERIFLHRPGWKLTPDPLASSLPRAGMTDLTTTCQSAPFACFLTFWHSGTSPGCPCVVVAMVLGSAIFPFSGELDLVSF